MIIREGCAGGRIDNRTSGAARLAGSGFNWLKSPFSTAWVGTWAIEEGGAVRMRVPWYPKKPKTLSFLIGAPIVPPNWFLFSVSLVAAKKSRASKSPLRTNSNASPWNWLVPDLVTTSTTAPGCSPYCAERLLVCNAELLNGIRKRKGQIDV